MNKTKNKNLIIYFFILVIFSTFAITSQINLTNDINLNSDAFFHLQRYINLCKRLQDGKIGLYMDYYAMHNYGYPTPLFYPELFMYPFAILTLFKIPYIVSFKLFIITIFFCTAISMFYVLNKYIEKNNKKQNIMSVIFSLIYAFNFLQYRHLVAGRYAELLAMIFIPLVLYGMYSLIEYNHGIKYIIFGMSGLIYSHILTAVFISITIFLLLLLNIKKILKNKNIIANLLKSALLTLLITAKQILPMLEMMTSDQYIYTYSFAKRPSFNEMTTQILKEINPIISIIICLSFIFFIIISNYISNKTKYIILGIFIFLFNTNLFDWSFIENNLTKFTDIIQFPRRIMPPVIALILIGLYILIYNNENYKIIKKITNTFIFLIFIINISIFAYGPMPNNNDYLYSNNVKSFDEGIYVGAYDYLSTKFDLQGITDEKDSYIEDIGNLFLNNKNNEEIIITQNKTTYNITSRTDKSTLELPILYYKGYKIKNDKNLEIKESENGLIEINNVEKNQEIIIKYSMTPIQIISLLISLFAIIFIIYLYKHSA